MLRKILWRKRHETEAYVYEEHRFSGRRRASPKGEVKRGPAHRDWLAGGVFMFERPKNV